MSSASSPGEERLLSVEAEAVIREVSFAVDHVSISDKLPNNTEVVYLNIRTKESKIFCVRLTIQGFAIVGSDFDNPSTVSSPSDKTSSSSPQKNENLIFYETIYQLLDANSEQYRNSFGMALHEKLKEIAKCT